MVNFSQSVCLSRARGSAAKVSARLRSLKLKRPRTQDLRCLGHLEGTSIVTEGINIIPEALSQGPFLTPEEHLAIAAWGGSCYCRNCAEISTAKYFTAGQGNTHLESQESAGLSQVDCHMLEASLDYTPRLSQTFFLQRGPGV